MTTHDLKTWPKFFAPVYNGIKTFELRRNDRNFQVGDILLLREWEPTHGGHFTGRECRRLVIYVMEAGVDAPLQGLVRDFCILGLAREP